MKGTARGGHIFRLLAVFEDGKQDSNALSSSASKANGNSFREKEKGRYAQLLDENRHIVYVSLTTKGKFYEIEQTTPHILQKSHLDGPSSVPSGGAQKQFNSDCVHRISSIVTPETELPITIRYVSGPQVNGSNGIPELLVINRVSTENVVIACSIEETESRQPLHLCKLPVTQDMRLIKSCLGFENEQKMFTNPNIQNVLKFCQINFDSFTKSVEFEQLATNVKSLTLNGSGKPKTEGLKILKPLHFPRLLRREKSMIAHEKEDSIIFLSKNDLENMENKEVQKRESGGVGSSNSKMKVFQSTKKKWFRNSKSSDKNESFGSVDMDIQSKRMSLDRYQDMSKLLIERFGGNAGLDAKDARPNSEIGVDNCRETDTSELRQRSMSLQDMDTRSERSEFSNRPDLVNIEFESGSAAAAAAYDQHRQPGTSADANDNDQEAAVLVNHLSNHQQQSFISPKMYTEFHVKTKQHSKSSSSLHQLLHFAVPQKMNVNETKKSSSTAHAAAKSNRISFIEDNSYDDLPYSNVRDSLVMPDPDDIVPHNGNNSHNENIYTEICSDYLLGNGAGAGSVESGGNGSSIRISVSSGRDRDTGSSSKMSGCSGMSRDNIYNTLN